MLDVLLGRELHDVVAVVIRYFGGTLLGVGGLVRAYGDAVHAAAELAGVCERRLWRQVRVEVDLSDVGRVENLLRSRWQVLDVHYGARADVSVLCAPPQLAELDAALAELTSGRAQTHIGPTVWA